MQLTLPPKYLTCGVFYSWSSKLFMISFSRCHQTCCTRTENCCTEDSSKNNTLPQSSDVQLRWTLTKLRLFFFIRGVSRGFRAGLQAFKPKFMYSRREIVDRLILTTAWESSLRIFLLELNGDRTAIFLMIWSSLLLFFKGSPTPLPVRINAILLKLGYCLVHSSFADP